MIKEQMQFIQMICKKLSQSVEAFAENGFSLGDRVNGKTAIKRMIVMLRSELLILERMIDNV